MTALTVYEALAAVQADLDAVGKDRSGKGINFTYRGVDDVYNALHPLLGRHGLIISPEVIEHSTTQFETKSGMQWTMTEVKIRYHLLGADGSTIPPEHCPVGVAQGSDNGDKGFGKAMSYCYKSTIAQLFSIPTNDPAMDNEHEPPPDRAATPPPRLGGWASDDEHDQARDSLLERLRNHRDNQPIMQKAAELGVLIETPDGYHAATALTKSKAIALRKTLDADDERQTA